MLIDILKILNTYGQSTTQQIVNVIPKKTGKTARSVKYEVTDDGAKATLRITGRPYFMAVQTGRRPTPGIKPSRTFVDNIREWLQASGGEQGAAYAIARSINEKGTKLWQKEGNTIISDIVNQSLIDKISHDALEKFANYYLVSVANLFDGNSNQSPTRA